MCEDCPHHRRAVTILAASGINLGDLAMAEQVLAEHGLRHNHIVLRDVVVCANNVRAQEVWRLRIWTALAKALDDAARAASKVPVAA